MAEFKEPLRSVLRDYCHVEWYEVIELAEDVKNNRQKFDTAALRFQWQQAIDDDVCDYLVLNKLTGNEFETDEEARLWLKVVYSQVFKA
ncbi:hypothetical protein ACEU07_21200 [Chromobacterium violaceum]|uniref:hypothetical protein n=1 Tax=Chromobacterium violaceum TaxID=536 RepID=UPI0035A6B68D